MTDESQFRIVVRAPVGQRVEKTEQQVAAIERVLRETIPPDELETIVSSTGVLGQGRSSLFNPNTGPHTSLVQVYLVSPDKRRRNQVQIMNEVRPKVVKLFPGVAMFFDPGGLVKRVTSFGSQKAVDVEIYGYDLEKARDVIRQVDAIMHQVHGLADVEVSREENYPELDINVDREKAALLGVSETDVANAVLFSLNGNGQTDPIIFTDPQNGNEYYISAWLAEEYRKDLSDLDNILLTTKAGEPVLLKNVAVVRQNAGPVKIDRKYFQRVIHITANPVNRDLGAIADDLEMRFAELQLPQGFSIRLAGQIQQQRETFQGLIFATVLAVLLVYMVMAAQFKSLIDPFHHHVFGSSGLAGRHPHTVPDEYDAFDHLVHGGDHDARDRRLERRAPGRLHQRAAATRHRPSGSGGARRANPATADPDDLIGDGLRPPADGHRDRHRWRDERATGPGRDRRPERLDHADAVSDPNVVLDAGGTIS